MGMRGSGALLVEDEVEGIELTVGVFPQKEPEGFVEPPTVPSDAQMNEAGELSGPPPDDVSGGEQPTQPMEEVCHHSSLTCFHKIMEEGEYLLKMEVNLHQMNSFTYKYETKIGTNVVII